MIDKLNKDYYSVIEQLCEGTMNNAHLLRDLEFHQSTPQYIVLCSKLIAEIQHYVQIRKAYYIPYIYELQEKNDASHNCGNCSGKCHVEHDLKLEEFKESLSGIKDMPYRLQMMSLPLHSETLYPEVYKALRNHMVLLENILTELFFLEETYLIPKVTEGQKNINARD